MKEDHYHEIEEIYREFAFANHGIKNHLIILEQYEETGEHEKALAYIRKLQVPLSKNISRYIKTVHDIIDIIFNYKLKEAGKTGISINVDCEIIPEWEIDNAINACSEISTGNK